MACLTTNNKYEIRLAAILSVEDTYWHVNVML